MTTTVHPDKRTMVAYALYATIFVEGLILASIGPTLDALADQSGSTTGQIAILFTANSLGYIIGSLLAGRVYARVTGNTALAIALIATAALTVFVPVAGTLGLLIALLGGIGIAIGLIDVGCNTLLVWLFGRDVPPYMNALHLGFGVGAVASPLLIDRFAAVTGDATTTFWLFAAVMIPIAIWIYRTPSPTPPLQTTSNGGGVVRRYRRLVTMMALFFAMHIGAQLSFAGWIFSYAEEIGRPETTARLLNSLFWAGLVAGRLLAISLSKTLRPVTMLVADLAGALTSIGVIGLFPDSSLALWLGTAGFGASVASIFATSINYTEQRMPITSHVTAVFLVGGSAGSMTLPWVVGQLFDSQGPGSLTWVVGGAVVAAIAIFALMNAASPVVTE